MHIHIANTIGFCPGVEKVVNKTLEIINDYPSANIYLIGSVVHNKLVNEQLVKYKNVKILKDSKDKTRLDLVKSIKTEGNIIIFSAHGTDPKAINYVESKGWKYFDLTCPFVQRILDKIKYGILHGYHIAYYGTKDHVEAIAAKAVGGSNLTVYKTKKDIDKLLSMPSLLLTTQSTMDVDDFKLTTTWFKYPQKVKVADLICHSSRSRQLEAKECKEYDIIFVLTDPESHNGLELFKELEKNHKNVMMIDPSKKIDTKSIINDKQSCAIFSSSSVSKQQVDEFVNKLK